MPSAFVNNPETGALLPRSFGWTEDAGGASPHYNATGAARILILPEGGVEVRIHAAGYRITARDRSVVAARRHVERWIYARLYGWKFAGARQSPAMCDYVPQQPGLGEV